jgi:fatty acid desaturase
MASAGLARAIGDDITRMRRHLRAEGLCKEIGRLRRPMIWRFLVAVGADWAMIFAAYAALLTWGWAAAPIALFAVGNRQRALGNLLHDAAHGGLGHGRRADLIAGLSLYLPLWTSMPIYRGEHFAHHRRLGDAKLDPDLIHREEDMGRSWIDLLRQHTLDSSTWRRSVVGHLLQAHPPELAAMLAWWAGLLSVLAAALGPLPALEFAALWLASRATVFHLVTTFRELADHVGLSPGSLIGFSRNLTAGGLMGAFFHPHNNGYHLAHHLNPGVPYWALPRAHALLLGWAEYAAAAHASSYFLGDDALVRGWVRRAKLGRPAAATSASPVAPTPLRLIAAPSTPDGRSCHSA